MVQGMTLLFSLQTAPGIFVRVLTLLLGIFSVLWFHYPCPLSPPLSHTYPGAFLTQP